MPMDRSRTVWLYCTMVEDGQTTGGQPEDGVYAIVDHLVEVPAGRVANDLLATVQIRSAFGGRYQVPEAVYRLASEREVEAHSTQHGQRQPVRHGPGDELLFAREDAPPPPAQPATEGAPEQVAGDTPEDGGKTGKDKGK